MSPSSRPPRFVKAGRRVDAYLSGHPILLAGCAILLASVPFRLVRSILDRDQFTLLYLPVIILAATRGGARAGLAAAGFAFCAWDLLFVPPYYTFSVDNPKDWISLLVFLVVGLGLGLQAGRMKEREERALVREQEIALLYRLSGHLVSQTSVSALAGILLDEVVSVTGAASAALLLPGVKQSLQMVRFAGSRDAILPAQVEAGAAPGLYIPLGVDNSVEGMLYLGARADGASLGPQEHHFLTYCSHLAAAFLERQRLLTAATQADALRQADAMKSNLVSSVSHELKTPLASITAAVTGLLEEDLEWEPEAIRAELSSIIPDLERLNASISELLDLSRLESGAWAPQREWHEVGDILGTVIQKIPRQQRGRMVLDVPEGLPLILVDYAQWASAIGNIIENALRYSPPDSPVRIQCIVVDDELWLSVEDEGPGITPEDRPHIFEKFFRGQASPGAGGTGLGLAIAFAVVHSHGGALRVQDRQPTGALFIITLPLRPLL